MARKHRRKCPKESHADKRRRQERTEILRGLKNGSIIRVDPSKVVSRSAIPPIPELYRDHLFACRDCGRKEVWTAGQQQLWYEEQGGDIESFAIRCRSCRRRENRRRARERKIHLEGLARKKSPPAA